MPGALAMHVLSAYDRFGGYIAPEDSHDLPRSRRIAGTATAPAIQSPALTPPE
jgi:hypothetical protein